MRSELLEPSGRSRHQLSLSSLPSTATSMAQLVDQPLALDLIRNINFEHKTNAHVYCVTLMLSMFNACLGTSRSATKNAGFNRPRAAAHQLSNIATKINSLMPRRTTKSKNSRGVEPRNHVKEVHKIRPKPSWSCCGLWPFITPNKLFFQFPAAAMPIPSTEIVRKRFSLRQSVR